MEIENTKEEILKVPEYITWRSHCYIVAPSAYFLGEGKPLKA